MNIVMVNVNDMTFSPKQNVQSKRRQMSGKLKDHELHKPVELTGGGN